MRMQYKFLNFFLDKKDLLTLNNEMIDPILIENNEQQLNDVYEFYKNERPILYVNGFLGTGKVQLINYSTNFLSEDTIILKHNCFETTILDDIFLTFFEEFKKLEAQKVINTPKVKSENFNQKIHSYFSTIEKPILIILDSFEALTDENKKDVIDFILHLTTFQKVKTILIGRTFKASLFPENYPLDRITTNALDKTLFEKFLKNNKIKYNKKVLDDLYKYTRGYHFFITLSIKIMQSKELQPETFLENFKKSFMNYYEFLEKESIDLVPAIAVRFFWLLCLFRHGMSIQLLKQLNLYDEESINILLENKILMKDDNQIYVQDYFKEQVDVSIPQNVAVKIHQNIVDIYEKQLPLKPLERTILLSRQTMRKEIEYHTMFLPKKVDPTKITKNEIGYVSYAKEKTLNMKEHSINNMSAKTPQQQPQKQEPQPTQNKEGKWVESNQNSFTAPQNVNINVELNKLGFDEKDLPFKLTQQEIEMLTASVESLQDVQQKALGNSNVTINVQNSQTNEQTSEQETAQEKVTLEDILQYAKEQETQYQYPKMIELYHIALTYNESDDYYTHLPVIYTKLGLAYQKMSDWENSLKYYELAREFYEQTLEKAKENYIKLNIANIYYETYKQDKARTYLMDIINSDNMPEVLITKAYIALANLEDSVSNINSAYEYYKKAISISNPAMDTETLSELYFKYALVADDKGDIQNALDYYKKCIELSSDETLNKYLSAAYSNIATLHLEKGEREIASKYFLKAYELDEKNNNYDGMYFSATKLAQTEQKVSREKTIEYLNKAKDCARKLNDTFYMASATLASGDYYYSQKENENALLEYLNAFDIAKNNFSRDNLSKIQMRIDDIKFRIGTATFTKIETEFRNGKNSNI